MAQVTFTADTTPSQADLDANFTELYSLKNRITTPGYTASSPAMTIDSSSNIGIGGASAGAKFQVAGSIVISSNLTNSVAVAGSSTGNAGIGVIADATFNVYATGTSSISFKTGATWTSAGALSGSGTERLNLSAAGTLTPGGDNSQTNGSASKRWSTVYAGTGTINTSDAREKTTVTPMTDAEIAAAKQLASEIGTYRFLDAIAAKGDGARTHVGMTVQRAIEIMELHGLDAMKYGFICFDEWEAGDRYAFRPDELMFFVARGFDARLAALEAA